MNLLLKTKNLSLWKQYFISIVFITAISVISYYFKDTFSYKIVALFLLFLVSVLAMLFDILPVLVSAILSALILNYFFIPPYFTFHINSPDDILLFLIYLSVALVSAVLSFKIRKEEEKSRDKEEKENTIKLYNTLLNSLSHELKTPISTIIGAVDTLKESREKLSEISQNELLDEIDDASLRLNRQVENLLNMSRLETGVFKLKLDWVDTNELIFSVIQKFEKQNHHQIIFEPKENLPFFKYDRVLIGQVLYNLIHNAIIYTPNFSIIEITAIPENEVLKITVSDNGNGFPEEEIAKVFDKFYRLPHSKTGGSGLGLSIAKGYIEAHNGTIELQNKENKGAVFTLKIPAEISYINQLKNE